MCVTQNKTHADRLPRFTENMIMVEHSNKRLGWYNVVSRDLYLRNYHSAITGEDERRTGGAGGRPARHASQRMRSEDVKSAAVQREMCVGVDCPAPPPTTLPRSFIIKLDLSSRHIYHQINSWLMTTDKYAHLAGLNPAVSLQAWCLLATIFEMTTTSIITTYVVAARSVEP